MFTLNTSNVGRREKKNKKRHLSEKKIKNTLPSNVRFEMISGAKWKIFFHSAGIHFGIQ